MPKNNIDVFDELDKFALLACQGYNLGNETDWFGSFRGGLHGLYARVFGINEHYRLLHDWLPSRLHHPQDTEYHLSSALFNMDSAVECLTFAVNALGFASYPEGFSDVTKHGGLKAISPWNILGANSNKPLAGYLKLYPSLQRHFSDNRDLLSEIFGLHSTSKHRETLYVGGQHRLDPPPGLFSGLGIENDASAQMQYSPHESILLKRIPKVPRIKRSSTARGELRTFEQIVPQLLDFLQTSGELALRDATANITLNFDTFQTGH